MSNAMNNMNRDVPNRSEDASRTGSVLNVLAGIWLIISAWVVGFSGVVAATWNCVLVGIAVLVLAAIRLGSHSASTQPLSWVNFILGIWLIIAPFALAFAAGSAMGNSVVLGILVAIFGLVAALATQPRAPLAR